MVTARPAPPPRSAVDPLERARKVLLHEQRTGHADRAAVGGLEGFLGRSLAAADDAAARAWLAEALRRLDGYAGWTPERREQALRDVLGNARGERYRTTRDRGPDRARDERPDLAPDRGLKPPATLAKGAEAPWPRADSDAGRGVRRESPAVPRSPGRQPAVAGFAPVPVAGAFLPRHEHAPHRAATPLAPAAAPAPAATNAARKPRPKPAVPALALSAPVGELPTVGPKAVQALGKLEVHTLRDLLYHFPRRHLDRRSIARIADLEPGQHATILATVWQAQTKRSPVQQRLFTEAILEDGSGFCHAVWFNQPYMARTLSRPGAVMLSGKVELGYDGAIQLAAPEVEFDIEDSLHAGRLVPFYPKTDGLSDKQLRTWIAMALEAGAERIFDPLPPDCRAAEALPGLREALAQAHFPDDDAARERALRRLAFDEFLLIQLGVLRRRREWQDSPGIEMRAELGVLREFAGLLPFELTPAQRRVIDEILADMARPVPMSRLLQGEVGSGKTVVAAAAGLVAVRSGYQAALMAPTEVLAQQHYRSVARLLDPFGLRVELVSGSQKKKEKAAVWEACRAGEIDVLVGTHALIQEEGEFAKLGLVIVDEQHRFGVRQRGALRQKGYNPDVLAMTATPIPRTLALSVYGDLDLSVIDELPPGRQRIGTFWIAPQNRHHAYDFLRKQVRAGRQAFIICPLIEDSDKIEARSARAEHERLQRQFPDLRLGLLHGKMPPKEKEAVMVSFRDGALDVLVSTAVVEVGIDVPNATVMLIEGADRFGLSQLHQFRGRVGRGEHKSYCLLLSDTPGAETNPRLNVVVNNHDGFALAEEDLKLRGPGEFFGTRQSGLPDLKVAKLSDVAVLEAARRQAQRLMEIDSELQAPEHAALALQVEAFWRSAADAA